MSTVALVVLDSLRADRFDARFDWLPGRSFRNAYSTANWTAPAHASLLTGRYGSEVGVLPSSPSLPTTAGYLPEQLGERGYVTRGLSANPFFSSRFGWDRGFDEFLGPDQLKNPSETVYFDWNPYTVAPGDGTLRAFRRYLRGITACLRSDADTWASMRRAYDLKFGGYAASREVEDDGAGTVLEFVREWTPTRDEFLVVNFMEAHVPYAPPAPYWSGTPVYLTAQHSLLEREPPDGAKQAYDAAVHYLSDVYREVFAALDEKCDYVVTCADHGELLGEHGGRWNHVYGVYPELARVPLVVSGDDLSGTDSRTVSLLDVHRTLAAITGVDVDSRGQSLLGEVTACDRLVEYRGLIDLARERLRDSGVPDSTVDDFDRPLFGLCGRDGCYGYETPDGWCRVGEPTVGPVEDRAARLRGELTVPRTRSETSSVDDADIQERLEDLGYV